MEDEHLLAGGNASGRVVRVGTTVRKPWTRATPEVQRFMKVVHQGGVDVPATFGRDEDGRQVIEFVPGQLAIDAGRLTHPELTRVGAIVRAIHDASESFTPSRVAKWDVAIPAPLQELICHNDLAPWNLIIGERWTFIDWDGAGPSSRLWDLGYAAQAFTLSDYGRDPADAALDLAAFVDGYDATTELRAALPDAMCERTIAMYELLRESHTTGREPWASMYADGHGDHWRNASEYVDTHGEIWAQALGHRGT